MTRGELFSELCLPGSPTRGGSKANDGFEGDCTVGINVVVISAGDDLT